MKNFNAFNRAPLPGPGSKQKLKTWRRLLWAACAVLLYGGYTYLSGSSGLIQYWRLHQRRNAVAREIAFLHSRQDSLGHVISLLQNDTTYIEQIARERYHMGRPGETIYTVVKRPASEAQQK